jgi:hypothetical protein
MGIMALEHQNISFYQGEDFMVLGTLYKDKKKTPEGLADTSLIWTLYDADRSIMFTKSTSDYSLTVLDNDDGTIRFSIGSSQTEGLPVGTYYHELWLTKAGKDILEFKGKLTLKEGHPP